MKLKYYSNTLVGCFPAQTFAGSFVVCHLSHFVVFNVTMLNMIDQRQECVDEKIDLGIKHQVL